MNFTSQKLIAVLALSGLTSGCATVVPQQLVDARDAYNSSSNGLAARMTPTELYDAKKVLDKANKEFAQKGDTAEVRDYSYIAQRKVELADVKARTELDRARIADARTQGVVVRDTQMKNLQEGWVKTREQLEASKNNVALKDKDLQQTSAQLDVEKNARMRAEAKLAGAMKDLAAIAAVKEEARGVVITLSGSVLFVSGKYALLETAKTKLDQVAEALKAQADTKRMVVEGHTDSMGSDAINQPLSLNRANAVRDYLVTRGVDSNKISAVGMSSTRPLVDNMSAENRANNRRVEIVIQPAQVSTR
jgi:outer membrane protein OmpA-like peptidoglycan-associated protein